MARLSDFPLPASGPWFVSPRGNDDIPSVDHLILHEVTLPASGEWRPSTPGWLFVRVSQGIAYLLSSGLTSELSQGEVVVFAPETQGIIRASQLGQVRLHSFRFCPDLLRDFFTAGERRQLETIMNKCAKEVFLPKNDSLGQQFANIVAKPVHGNLLSQRCKTLFLAMTCFGVDSLNWEAQEASPAVNIEPSDRFRQQVSDQAILDYSTAELAGLCGFSRRHFSRKFREYFGVTIQNKRTALRLAKARRLLAGKDKKIIHVALECGYRSLRLFNESFKKHYGTTPSDWQRRMPAKARVQAENDGVEM